MPRAEGPPAPCRLGPPPPASAPIDRVGTLGPYSASCSNREDEVTSARGQSPGVVIAGWGSTAGVRSLLRPSIFLRPRPVRSGRRVQPRPSPTSSCRSCSGWRKSFLMGNFRRTRPVFLREYSTDRMAGGLRPAPGCRIARQQSGQSQSQSIDRGERCPPIRLPSPPPIHPARAGLRTPRIRGRRGPWRAPEDWSGGGSSSSS